MKLHSTTVAARTVPARTSLLLGRRSGISAAIILLTTLMFFAANTAFAQNTNAAQSVAALLKAFGPVPVTRTINHLHVGTVCTPGGRCLTRAVTISEQRHSSEILTASNIAIVRSNPIEFGQTVQTSLTNKLVVNGDYWNNCASQPSTKQSQITVSYMRSTGVQVSRTVTDTLGTQLQVQWKPTIDVDGVTTSDWSFTGTINIQHQEANGRIDSTGWSQTDQFTEQQSASLQPYTAIYAEIQTWPVTYSAKFSTVAVVDADISRNDKGYRKLSDMFPEAKRTFPIEGTVEATDAAKAQLGSRLIKPTTL